MKMNKKVIMPLAILAAFMMLSVAVVITGTTVTDATSVNVTVEPAKLHDNATENPIPDDELFTSATYIASEESQTGYKIVRISIQGLKAHENALHNKGLWIGAAFVPSVTDGTTVSYRQAETQSALADVDYTLNNGDGSLDTNVDQDGSSKSGFAAYYTPLSSKFWIQLKWINGNDTVEVTYHIVLSVSNNVEAYNTETDSSAMALGQNVRMVEGTSTSATYFNTLDAAVNSMKTVMSTDVTLTVLKSHIGADNLKLEAGNRNSYSANDHKLTIDLNNKVYTTPVIGAVGTGGLDDKSVYLGFGFDVVELKNGEIKGNASNEDASVLMKTFIPTLNIVNVTLDASEMPITKKHFNGNYPGITDGSALFIANGKVTLDDKSVIIGSEKASAAAIYGYYQKATSGIWTTYAGSELEVNGASVKGDINIASEGYGQLSGSDQENNNKPATLTFKSGTYEGKILVVKGGTFNKSGNTEGTGAETVNITDMTVATGKTVVIDKDVEANISGTVSINGAITNTGNIIIADGATVEFGANGSIASTSGIIRLLGDGTTQVSSSNSGAEITLTGTAKVAFDGGATPELYIGVSDENASASIDYDTTDNNKLTISATAGTLTMTGPIYPDWTVNVTNAAFAYNGASVYGAVNLGVGSELTLGTSGANVTVEGSKAIINLTGNTQESAAILASKGLILKNGAKVMFSSTVSTTAGATSTVTVGKVDDSKLPIAGEGDFEMTGPIYSEFDVKVISGIFTYKGTQVDGDVKVTGEDASIKLASSSAVIVTSNIEIRNPTGVAAMNLGSNGLKLTGTASISFYNGASPNPNAVTSVSESGSTTITGTYAALNINETSGKLTMTGGIYSGWNVTVAKDTEFEFKGTVVDGTVINNGGTITIPNDCTVEFGTAGKFTSIGGLVDLQNPLGTGAVTSENDGECIILKDNAMVLFSDYVKTTVGDASETGIEITDGGLVITAKKGTLAMTGPVYTGWELNINKGATFDVALDETVMVYDGAVLNNSGTVNVYGTLRDSFAHDQTGQMIENSGVINVYGTLMVGILENKGVNIDGKIVFFEGSEFLNKVGENDGDVNILISDDEDSLICLESGSVTIDAKSVGGAVAYTLDKSSEATFVQSNAGGFYFKSGDSITVNGVLHLYEMIIPSGVTLNVNGTTVLNDGDVIVIEGTGKIVMSNNGKIDGDTAGLIYFGDAASGSKVITAANGAQFNITLDGGNVGTTDVESIVILTSIKAGDGGVVVTKGSVYINGTLATVDETGTVVLPSVAAGNTVYISGSVDNGVTINVPADMTLEVASGTSLTFENGSALVGTVTIPQGSGSSVTYEKGSTVNGTVIEVTTKIDEKGEHVTVIIILRTANADKLLLKVDGEYCDVAYIEAFQGDRFGDALAGVEVESLKSRVTFTGWFNNLNEKVTSTMTVGNASSTLTAQYDETARVPVEPTPTVIEPSVVTVGEAGSDYSMIVAIGMLIVSIIVLGFVVLKKRN